jgi:putative pyruvate formate lyase activating enzyme
MGRVVGDEEFARICLTLQVRGAENINLVTGSHAAAALVRGITLARAKGLCIPVLWNSSSYEGEAILSLLKDTVDVYLPDLKTLDPALAERFFKAPDYPEYAAAAILRMMEQRELRYHKHGRALASGVIIRHLILPGCLDATLDVLRWFADHARGRALLSLMTQYTPVIPPEASGAVDTPNRHIRREEYDQVLRWLEELEIEDGFYQELVPDTGWLPDFTRQNPFSAHNESSELSEPVWHWQEGFVRAGGLGYT